MTKLKIGTLSKRSQTNKYSKNIIELTNWKERNFVLLTDELEYYSDDINDPKNLKGSIKCCDIQCVEVVQDGVFDKKKYLFQVVHADSILYVSALANEERTDWIEKIAAVIVNNDNLLAFYHPSIYDDSPGKDSWKCCNAKFFTAIGCKKVTTIDENVLQKSVTKTSSGRTIESTVGTIRTAGAKANISGWLYKQGEKDIFKQWKKRWFVYNNETAHFDYYVSPDGEHKGFINFREVMSIIKNMDPNSSGVASFAIMTPNRDYLIRSDTAHECLRWVDMLEAKIKELDG